MPGVDWGVYDYGGEEGTEVSSTYEGRHITCTAAELITDSGSGVATKGHACIFGLVGLQAVGVCFNTGTLTDLIAIDTEGIWNLPVTGKDDAGNRALLPGEPVFIHNTTCEISGIRDNATQVPLGYLLTEAATTVETISVVKVHWDPRAHWLQDQEMLYFGDARDVSVEWDEANLEWLPVTDDTGMFVLGNGTLNFANFRCYGMTVNDMIDYDTSVGLLLITNTAIGADARAERHVHVCATPAMTDGYGVEEHDLTISGIATGMISANSHWINFGGAGVAGGYVHVHNDGIWSGGDISGGYVSWAKFQFLPDSNPNWMSLWELNFAGANSEIDAIFNVNDPTLALGYTAGGAAEADVPIGYCPFFSTAHGALRGYVYIFAHP